MIGPRWHHTGVLSNPVMIKELRQTVKGKMAVLGMNFMLIVLIVIFSISLLNFDENENFGRNMFYGVVSVLGIICLIVVPMNLFNRTGAERDPEDQDLMYITALSPHKIVLGKYAAGILVVLLYGCASLPFIAFTYLLKGVDFLAIGLALGHGFLMVFLSIQMAILLGCLPMNKKSRVGFMGFGVVFFWIILSMGVPFSLSRRGMGVPFIGALTVNFWFSTMVIVFLVVLIYLLTIARLKPLTANRAFVPRVYLSGMWLLGLIGIVLTRNVVLFHLWLILFYGISLFSLILATSERDRISARIRRGIPDGPGRVPAFLFFSGSGSGILWSLITLAGTLGFSYFLGHLGWFTAYFPVGPFVNDYLPRFVMSALSVTGYSLIFYGLTRLLRRENLMTKTWALTVAIMFIIAAITGILVESVEKPKDLYIATPLCGVFLKSDDLFLILLWSWAGIALLPSLLIVIKQFRAFKPLSDQSIAAPVPSVSPKVDDHEVPVQ